MLNAHEAYLLGLTPGIVGAFYDGMAILEATKPAELEVWVGTRGKDLARQIHLVDELLRRLHLEPGDPPLTMLAYHEWAEETRDRAALATRVAYDNEEELGAKAALLRVRLALDVGEQLGELVHLHVVASLAQGILGEQPGATWLLGHARGLGRAQDAAIERLERVVGYAEDDVRAEVERLLAVLRVGPRADAGGDHGAAARALGGLVAALDLPRVEALFRTE